MERATDLLRRAATTARPRRLGLAALTVCALVSGCQERVYQGQPVPTTTTTRNATGATTTTTTTAGQPSTTSPPVSTTTTTSGQATTGSTTTTAPGGWWKPKPGLTWQWQLNGRVDTGVDAQVFDIDLVATEASEVKTLHDKGRKVICYVNAGASEDFRPDARSFPAAIKGNGNSWPGEQWLDIRKADVLKPIMAKRFDLCKQKGFDGIEVDLVDGYKANTGFPLTAADQLRYNRTLVTLAHERGLAVGLKNDLDQIKDLVNEFDFAVNEQCAEFDECGALKSFIDAGKAVFHAEYDTELSQFCSIAKKLGLSSIRKNVALEASPRQVC
jgi:hypothetical protein